MNQLSPDEIDTISQVKNLQAREVLSRNEVSPGELLAIKKLDQVQQVTGYSMKEKGQYLVNFSISDYPKLAINIAQSLATAEPVEKFIVSNALATFSQKEKGKITVDNRHNSIRDCLGTAEFNDKLVDMSQSWLIEKTKGKKFKEQLEEQEKNLQLLIISKPSRSYLRFSRSLALNPWTESLPPTAERMVLGWLSKQSTQCYECDPKQIRQFR